MDHQSKYPYMLRRRCAQCDEEHEVRIDNFDALRRKYFCCPDCKSLHRSEASRLSAIGRGHVVKQAYKPRKKRGKKSAEVTVKNDRQTEYVRQLRKMYGIQEEQRA